MSESHDHKHAHAGHGDVDQHVRAAYYVFGSLLVLTGFTVGAYFLHLPHKLAITLALLIATVKGTLVAAWFMHLVSERKMIHWMLGSRPCCSSRCCSCRRSRSSTAIMLR